MEEWTNPKYLEKLKSKSYDICIDARESKAGVESFYDDNASSTDSFLCGS